MTQLLEEHQPIVKTSPRALFVAPQNESPCKRESHIDFRSHLPMWAYPNEVTKLADDTFSPKDEPVPMRCAAGPAVRWMWLSSVMLTVASIILFTLTLKWAVCTETGVEAYPLWLLAAMSPFVMCNYCIEVVSARYTIIPYVQVVQGFKVLSIPVGFSAWCIQSFALSSLMLADTGTDNFFGATTLLLNACQERRGIQPGVVALWKFSMEQSMLRWARNVDFRVIVFVTWLFSCVKQVYGLIETLPRWTELREMNFDVGQDVRPWHNVCGTKVTGGDVVHTLGEACCMASIKSQALDYPMAKERQLRREALLKAPCFDIGRSLFFLRHACVRGVGTILISAILSNGLQINVQVALLAMQMSSVGKSNQFQAPQATVSIAVSILTSMLKLADAIKVLLYAREVLTAIDSVVDAKQITLEEKEVNDIGVVKRYVFIMAVCCVVFVAIFAQAMCSLAAVYICEDSLWNLSGCVNLDSLEH